MSQTKSKNIILCADGTGNEGGYTPDSNVYKMYNAIDIHDPKQEQIVFYDNGVGTQKNKYIRGVSAAVGIGFQANVCDLYEFLARHYNPGDKIFMFGFSRGAATIRAFNGFVDACGLIDGREDGNKELKNKVALAMKAYAKPKKEQKDQILTPVNIHDNMPDIHFIGVWDTVSALGFPERKNLVGLTLWVLHKIAHVFGTIIDKIWPYKFYNYELTSNVKNAFQALAIDDERTSFWPKVWNEKSAIKLNENMNVQQVWFTGMHSNIGGGYERAGLANVSFDWMLDNLQNTGLLFKDGFLDSAKADANVNGRQYNSREGLASFYRYHPRKIGDLCTKANAKINIHESVMDRLNRRTANYVPRLLPMKFNVVDNQGRSKESPEVHEKHWHFFNRGVKKLIHIRKILYAISIEMAIVFVGSIFYSVILSKNADAIKSSNVEYNLLQGYLIDVMEFLTPDTYDDVIQYLVVDNWEYGLIMAILVIIYYIARKKARSLTNVWAERLRKLYIKSPNAHPDFSTDKGIKKIK